LLYSALGSSRLLVRIINWGTGRDSETLERRVCWYCRCALIQPQICGFSGAIRVHFTALPDLLLNIDGVYPGKDFHSFIHNPASPEVIVAETEPTARHQKPAYCGTPNILMIRVNQAHVGT
jgi:hypothetical protein